MPGANYDGYDDDDENNIYDDDDDDDDDEWRVPPSCLPALTTLPAQGRSTTTMPQLYFDMIPIKCFFDKHTSLFDTLYTILQHCTNFTLRSRYQMLTLTNTHLCLTHYTILQHCINCTSSVGRSG